MRFSLLLTTALVVCGAARGQVSYIPPSPLAQIIQGQPTASQLNAALVPVNLRAPLVTDDTTKGYAIGNLWCTLGQCWQAQLTVAASAAYWANLAVNQGGVTPLALDIASASGYQAKAWYGLQLATRNANVLALNKAFDVWRSLDGTTKTIGWTGNGDADAAAADAFCNSATGSYVSCEISQIYDQSYNISSGALQSNNATQTPGYLLGTATVSTGGTCTPGAGTFTLVGGSGTAATFTGTVTGTTLGGTLTTLSTGSYYVLPTNPITVTATGVTCSVAPTVNVSTSYNAQGWTQRAPLWTHNLINGHRGASFQLNYDQAQPTWPTLPPGEVVSEWMTLPAISSNYNSLSLIFAGTPNNAMQSTSTGKNVLAKFGPAASDVNFSTNNTTTANTPTPSVYGSANSSSPIPALSSPSVWAFETGSTSTLVDAANFSENITLSLSSTGLTGGSIGSGALGAGEYANFDMLHMGFFNSTIDSTTLTNMQASLDLAGGFVPQARNFVVQVGDSISTGFQSTFGNNWPKYLATIGLLPATLEVANIGVNGAQFSGGTYDFTANVAANWLSMCPAGYNIVAIVALGANDITNGASPATAFSRAQTLSSDISAQCPAAKIVFADINSRTDQTTPIYNNMLAFNALEKATGLQAVAAGGLGAYGIVDFQGAPYWQSASFTNCLVHGGHPQDCGSANMAQVAAPVLLPLLQ